MGHGRADEASPIKRSYFFGTEEVFVYSGYGGSVYSHSKYSPWLLTQEFNCISKQAANHADFYTLKIWDQSVHWLKSYDQKVSFCPKQLFGYNF